MLERACAELWGKLKPIPEQIALISDNYRFKVVPAGRRCLAEGTLVKTPSGSKKIEKLDIGDLVIGWEGKEVATRVNKVFKNGIQKVTPLVASNGETYVVATYNHRILTKKGHTHVKDINAWNNVLTTTGSIALHKEKAHLQTTYDITVNNETNLYVLANGVITHNSGKTERGMRFMIKECLKNPNRSYFIAAPTFNQVERLYWRNLLARIPPQVVIEKNKSKLEIVFINNTILSLIGLDKPERMEGALWHGGIIDETDNVKQDAWESNILPALGTKDIRDPDYKAWCWLIGVPEGRGLLYKTHLFGLSEEPKYKDWKTYTWHSSAVLSEESLQMYRDSMDPKKFRREWEASFEEVGNTVVHAFSVKENVRHCADNGGDIVCGMDFNLRPMSALLGTIVGRCLYIWKEYERSPSNTQDLMETINGDFPNRNLLVYPDPTGQSGKSSANFGVTDHAIIERLGGTVIAPKSNKSNKDAINILNAMFCNANYERRIFIDPSCIRLIECLLGWQYDMRLSGDQPDKRQGYDHLPDALKYITLSAFDVLQLQSKVIITQADIY